MKRKKLQKKLISKGPPLLGLKLQEIPTNGGLIFKELGESI